jgi:hypothetical protein
MSKDGCGDASGRYVLIDVSNYEKRQKNSKISGAQKNTNKKKLRKNIYCVLCGLKISAGGLLKHKELVHDEKIIPRQASVEGQLRLWISFVQGGLPSLGKRK